MTIKRWIASKDNTITNAFNDNLVTRATGSNLGEADVVEVFSIYAQAASNSLEKSRAILEFPVDQILTERNQGNIPASGSVSFYLKMSNATHPFTLPEKYTLSINALSKSWDEGYGLFIETQEYQTGFLLPLRKLGLLKEVIFIVVHNFHNISSKVMRIWS